MRVAEARVLELDEERTNMNVADYFVDAVKMHTKDCDKDCQVYWANDLGTAACNYNLFDKEMRRVRVMKCVTCGKHAEYRLTGVGQ